MFLLEKLDKKIHDRESFACENQELTRYLLKFARQDLEKGFSVTYVAVKKEDKNIKKKIYGYFTLTNYSVVKNEDVSKNIPMAGYDTIPAILIGRLAKNSSQSELKGYTLLGQALMKCKEAASISSAVLVLVEPIDQNAESFYVKQGFLRLESQTDKNFYFYPIFRIPS